MTLDRAVKMVKDAFRMVSEREIQTGDSINLVVMEAGKELKMTRVSLRED
jgi:20S proteasome alpha/beta subunit